MKQRILRAGLLSAASVVISLSTPAAVQANNYGESLAWQFQTTADHANLAVIADLIERKRAGGYAAPVYTTTVERQYNCGITADVTGNSGAQTALANSPSVTGATSSANGNVSDTGISGRSSSASSTHQANSGKVTSGLSGGTSAVGRGFADQTLSSSQTNSGTQSASVERSAACLFGALN